MARFGYTDIADFRRNGLNEMGKELYSQYANDLARFDLGLELLVYGFSTKGGRHIFEVSNPGKISSHNLRGYAAIGSGSLMALAALTRRPMPPDLTNTIYRLLDAKFSAETAREVGKRTYVITMNATGKFGIMAQTNIEKVRAIWEASLKEPEPEEALELIKQSQAVKAISGAEP